MTSKFKQAFPGFKGGGYYGTFLPNRTILSFYRVFDGKTSFRSTSRMQEFRL
jgi:hypothetical protein